jgi:hypothetical protein
MILDQAGAIGANNSLSRVANAFADLGSHVGSADPQRTPDAVTRVAVKHVPGARWASMTVLRGDQFLTLAATADEARLCDAVQYELRSGPCVDAVLDDAVYAPADLRNDPRWPEFGKRVSTDYGVESMLSYRLAVDLDDVIAGMNLYGDRPHAFNRESVEMGLLLATHAALAVSAALSKERADNLQQALESNRDIGVAMGVLMMKHKLTRQQAFDLLRVASQHSNRKLRDIAVEVADTGALDLPATSHRGDQPSNGSRRHP